VWVLGIEGEVALGTEIVVWVNAGLETTEEEGSRFRSFMSGLTNLDIGFGGGPTGVLGLYTICFCWTGPPVGAFLVITGLETWEMGLELLLIIWA
jgi:hypothetical protein